MAAYVIAFVEVEDLEIYAAQYVPILLSTLAQFGGAILASTDEIHVKEPPWPVGRTVVLEFPSLIRAQQWYHSAEYRPLIKLRTTIASSCLAMFEGLA